MTRNERLVAEEMKRRGIDYGTVWTGGDGVARGRSSWGGVFSPIITVPDDKDYNIFGNSRRSKFK